MTLKILKILKTINDNGSSRTHLIYVVHQDTLFLRISLLLLKIALMHQKIPICLKHQEKVVAARSLIKLHFLSRKKKMFSADQHSTYKKNIGEALRNIDGLK